MNPKCRKCKVSLIVGDNITQDKIDTSNYICRKCNTTSMREYRHRTGKYQPMAKNRSCSSFLGVHVAERVLSRIFKDVERRPYGSPGYDFICNGGYLIDVKSACRRHIKKHSDLWQFRINMNQVANYFLCIAFDDRELLNPEYVWLIPASDVSGSVSIAISESTIQKWDEYKLDVTKVTRCCDVLKENPNQ